MIIIQKLRKSEKYRMSFKNFIKRIVTVCCAAVVVAAVYAFVINGYVIHKTRAEVLDIDEASQLGGIDCILVLGASVKPDKTPSNMLYDRIMTGVSLYKAGVSARIIMSGDHGRSDYNEVGTMKEYAVNEGVPSEDIFMDHAGFSTYESLYRAKEIFGADRIIIVSQEYHLYRALYIAKALGIEAYGVSADLRSYSGQYKRELREILARNKDFILAIAKPVPSVLGDSISLDGSGDVTND